jgi:hypothetical protein
MAAKKNKNSIFSPKKGAALAGLKRKGAKGKGRAGGGG